MYVLFVLHGFKLVVDEGETTRAKWNRANGDRGETTHGTNGIWTRIRLYDDKNTLIS